jgi:TPR repeat protein
MVRLLLLIVPLVVAAQPQLPPHSKALPQGIEQLTVSAEQGNPEAQFQLGMMHYRGEGTPQDYGQALRWLSSAAEQGLPLAQYRLGVAYARGRGTPQDYGQALRWYQSAADKGLADAQYELGELHFRGLGTPVDYVQARRRYQSAAEQGDFLSQFLLGFMHRHGLGKAPDLMRAHMWFSLAETTAGDDDRASRRERRSLETVMTRQQLTTARKMAADCRAQNLKRCD